MRIALIGLALVLGPAAPRVFTKGEPAPHGLNPAQMMLYADAQGDPKAGTFGLPDAFAGDLGLEDLGRGTLRATIRTSQGSIACTLFEREAPLTVANFVGLARGTRPFLDPTRDTWITEPFYKGTSFHRVVKGFVIQGGDRVGDGTGGVGYVIPDELDNGFTFDRPGMLAMANRGKGTASNQFFITVAKTPHLKATHTIFGRCDAKVPIQISGVPVDKRRTHRPHTAVVLESITFTRRK